MTHDPTHDDPATEQPVVAPEDSGEHSAAEHSAGEQSAEEGGGSADQGSGSSGQSHQQAATSAASAAAAGAASGAGGGIGSAATGAGQGAADSAMASGTQAASGALEEAVPEETQAVVAAGTQVATSTAQAAISDPSSAGAAAASSAVGAGAGAANSAVSEELGAAVPVVEAAGSMASGAIGRALSGGGESGASGSGPGSPGSGTGSSGSFATHDAETRHYAGFQSAGGSAAEAAVDAAASLLGDDEGQVDALFECPDSDVFFDVLSFKVKERLNTPYIISATLGTDNVDAEMSTLLGLSCSICLTRDGTAMQEQRFCGVISELVEGASSAHRAEVELTIVPALKLMELRKDTRIFQEMSVPDILEKVFGGGLGPFGRSAKLNLNREYPTCEYRTQYNETDLDFALRLMEEEGIVFYFDHQGEAEQLMLIDDPSQHLDIERPAGPEVELLQYESGQGNLEVLRELHRKGALVPTKLTLRHWNWTTSRMAEGEVAAEPPPDGELPEGAASGPEREQYEHDDQPLTLHEYGGTYAANDADDQTRLRREAQAWPGKVASGKGTVLSFRPGHRFALSGHRALELDGEYLLFEVEHRWGVDEPERYSNSLKALPADVPFRPQRRKEHHRVVGMHTATVVGPAGDEIHTDEHGRIKVQFHWDRHGNFDDHSSCFLRVIQAWAGSGWGFVFLPRIGMEVTVQFIGGDPDRPVVSGALYNGDNPPPLSLPDEMTRSTIRSQSTKEADGYNELTFEDLAGEEQIIVHAQKDYNETVENDHSTTVHGSQTQTVDGSQTETVGGKQTLHVKKNRSVTVDGSQNVTVGGGEAGEGVTGAALNVTGDYQVDASKTIQKQAPDKICLVCGDSKIEMVPGKITLETAGSKIELTADIISTAANGAYAQLKDFAKMASPQGSEVYLKDGGLYKSSQGSEVKLDANVQATSVGGSQVKLDNNALMAGTVEATVQGVKAALMGQAEAKVAAPQSMVEGQAMATVKGGSGTVSADAMGVSLMGPIVKAN